MAVHHVSVLGAVGLAPCVLGKLSATGVRLSPRSQLLWATTIVDCAVYRKLSSNQCEMYCFDMGFQIYFIFIVYACVAMCV